MTVEAPQAERAVAAPLLDGKRILVTGVLTDRSLAYHAAARMQQLGAEIVLTGHGRARRITQRAATALPEPPDVLELDVLKPEDFDALRDELRERWGYVDGVFHSVAFAPQDVWEGEFVDTSHDSLDTTMRASVYSLQSLAGALLPLLRESPGGASLLTLTVMAGRMSTHYAWMGVVKATLDALMRHLAVELGPQGIRSNAIAAGPMRTNASTGIPGFKELERMVVEKAPLGWDSSDPSAVSGPACFLLSDLARAVSGEILHVDGGFHAAL